MFRSANFIALCLLPLLASAQTVQYPNIGRTATPQEIRAWDIDVRPDFKGLPKGRGSVQQGEVLWEAQCASCHGHFGESAEVFTPIAGGVTLDDMATGRVRSLLPGQNQPQRTTLMKLSILSTLWDYINRAMPWNAPKSLSVDEVYAAVAYTLHLNNVLPADFVLSDINIRDVQARLPNRNGMTTAHSLWPGQELSGKQGNLFRPDVQGSACMANCAVPTMVVSSLPDYSRNAHGNLAEQFRTIGPTRGAETADSNGVGIAKNSQNNSLNATPDQLKRAQIATESIAIAVPGVSLAAIQPMLNKNACMACHGLNTKLIGSSFKDISARYKTANGAVNLLSDKIKNGSQGVWGAIPMPAQTLSVQESAQIAQWLVSGMPP